MGILLGTNLIYAKQWYVLNGQNMKCEKHKYSPYDYKKIGGTLQEISDGMFYYTADNGAMLVFGDSLEKCNTLRDVAKRAK